MRKRCFAFKSCYAHQSFTGENHTPTDPNKLLARKSGGFTFKGVKFPVTIKHRTARVKIYGPSEKFASYRIYYRVAGKAVFRGFTTYGEAKTAAETAAKDISKGSAVPSFSTRATNDALAAMERLNELFRATGKRVFRKRLRKLLLGVVVVLVLGFGVIAGSIYFEIHRAHGEVLTNGKKRTYLLHVPKTYQPGRPTPLVISLHGFAEWPAHLMRLSHWNQLAEEFGFLVAYPSGSSFPLRWFCNGRLNTTEQAQQDVQFIADLIDQLKKNYSIDEARVYANGLSNGGGMSFLLASRLSERIAAIGSVGGAYLHPWSEFKPKRPVPAIIFHGTADPIVPFHGGPSGMFKIPFPDIPNWVQSLAERNGCQTNFVSLPDSGSVSGVCYKAGTNNAEVVFYTVAGGGHSWPGGEEMPTFIVGHTTPDVDATRLMWHFFQQHSMAR